MCKALKIVLYDEQVQRLENVKPFAPLFPQIEFGFDPSRTIKGTQDSPFAMVCTLSRLTSRKLMKPSRCRTSNGSGLQNPLDPLGLHRREAECETWDSPRNDILYELICNTYILSRGYLQANSPQPVINGPQNATVIPLFPRDRLRPC